MKITEETINKVMSKNKGCTTTKKCKECKSRYDCGCAVMDEILVSLIKEV